jgi:hypothetical protein
MAAKRATRVARSMVKTRILKTQEGSRWGRRRVRERGTVAWTKVSREARRGASVAIKKT